MNEKYREAKRQSWTKFIETERGRACADNKDNGITGKPYLNAIALALFAGFDLGAEYEFERAISNMTSVEDIADARVGALSEEDQALFKKLLKQCDHVWDVYGGESLLPFNGMTRVYGTDGMWWHACGATYDEGRGDDKESGESECSCDLCIQLRKIFEVKNAEEG